MPETLDELMERASQALVTMDYLGCESLCLTALAKARQSRDWAYYAAVLLPLQEARRQRRMIAAEGVIRLGSQALRGGLKAWCASCAAGCIVLTYPHTPRDAHQLILDARHERRFIEVLFADCSSDASRWKLQSFSRAIGTLGVTREIDAPPRDWIEKNLKPDKARSLPSAQTPSDWFIDATEALGDAALALAEKESVPALKLDLLEKMLDVVTDHELLHQALGRTARLMAKTTPAPSASAPTGVA